MTTVRGTLRSTETRESEASAPDTSTARAAALEQLDLTTFELQQANPVAGSPGGQTTVRAIARSVGAQLRRRTAGVPRRRGRRITGKPYDHDDITSSMRGDGWRGDPVDVVEMPDGAVTSMDNTRIRAARETDTPVQALAHDHHEPLSDLDARRFRKNGREPATWGEAATVRIEGQGSTWSRANPAGSHNLPLLTGSPR